MKKKIGFALGAGGARGIAHIGFLQAMEENGIYPDYIAGSSMGSILGACYAAGMKPEKMRETLLGMKASTIVDLGLLPVSRKGFLKWDKTRAFLEKLVPARTFSDLKIPLTCVSVDLKTGGLCAISEGDLWDAVLASGSIPAVFRPVESEGRLLVDGGVLCRVPVKQVKEMGADVTVAVDVIGRGQPEEKIGNTIMVILRTYDIMNETMTARQKEEYAEICDVWLEPEMGDLSQYKIKYYPEAYDAGYKAGREQAERIRRLAGIE